MDLRNYCDNDAGGLDDNIAVLSRTQAEVYLRRWDLLLQVEALLVPLGHHFLRNVLVEQFGLRLGRFLPVAEKACNLKSWRSTHGPHGTGSHNCSSSGTYRDDMLQESVQQSVDRLEAGGEWLRCPDHPWVTVSGSTSQAVCSGETWTAEALA